MARRFIPALLIGLLVIVHAQLWFGRGSLPRVASLKQQLATQELANRDAQLRNDQLVSEVRDLQEGLGMVEELARQELGMVRPNEIFVQIAKGRP
ncbi:septum formation initiator family protein [Hydrogenophaga sp. BPS33]|uniref:septum formation initiator family protein n=1 Tax=Hydrogenophaga sp. BPS33 TaxID=2651974 RepID=UPI00131F55D7|nr:septum formation initiator family protein [Hydrogenophaga sp. BPS33]QHE87021.1 septation ring formation regulator EzrA [Hydrogenophaga sp. BPS33]